MQPMKEYMLRLAKCKTKLKRTLNRAEGGQYIYIYYLLINIFIALHNVSVYKPNNLVIIYYNQMWNLNVRNQVCYRVYSVCDQKYPFSSLCGQPLRIFRGQWCANQFERVRVKLMLAELMPLPVESGSTETNRSADIWTPPTPAADKIEKLYLNRGTDDTVSDVWILSCYRKLKVCSLSAQKDQRTTYILQQFQLFNIMWICISNSPTLSTLRTSLLRKEEIVSLWRLQLPRTFTRLSFVNLFAK